MALSHRPRSFVVTALLLSAAACSGAAEAPVAPSPSGSAAPPVPAPPVAPPASGAAAVAPAQKPDPADGGLPDAAPVALAVRAECAKGTCSLARLVPDEVSRALGEDGPVAIWEEVLADKAEVSFPVDAGAEVFGLLLDGAVEVRPHDKGTPKHTIDARWHGFRAPGAGISVAALGKPARVAFVVVAVLPDASLAAHVKRLAAKDRALGWTERQKRLDGIDFVSAEDIAWDEGAYHARVGWAAHTYRYGTDGGTGKKTWDVDDRPAAVVDLLKMSKNAPVAEHAHDKEHECLAIFEGAGTLVRAGAAGDVAVKPGTVVCIPAGVRHAWKPSGTSPLFAMQVYSPPGPEARYKHVLDRSSGPGAR